MLRTCLFMLCLALAIPAGAQQSTAVSPQSGTINGIVVDVNDNVVPAAIAILDGLSSSEHQTTTANDNGSFEFHGLRLGSPYRVTIQAKGFTSWTSPAVTLKTDDPTLQLTGIKLQITDAVTSVTVYASSEQIATEQVRVEEQQKVLGFIPNFYVVYDSTNVVPLTAKLKFRLALKTATNPVTAAGVTFLAGVNQVANTPDYPQGAKGYGQRVGTVAADGFGNILIGGAILPSLLHQDPRYFYQGTGTTKSRLRHALSSPFVCRGDDGRPQPNYSTIGGDLISSALSNTYYPESNRGPGLVFGTFAINTAERMISSVAQEFILSRLTSRPGKRHQDF